MSEKLTSIPVFTDGYAERWTAWQARGDSDDRATGRKLFVLIITLLLSGAVISGLRWF